MERGATAIVLVLLLVALLLLTGATFADEVILFPGDGVMDDETKPCCKETVCSKGLLCYCADLFEDKECGGTCRNCKVKKGSEPGTRSYMCRDASWGGGPLPECKEGGK